MRINLDEVFSDPANEAFMVARAAAIQEYANLEQSLCDLFAYVSGTSPVVAGTIFFAMVNARSRVRVLEQLMKLKHGADYGTFFVSAMKLLPALDQDRNNIVHWHTSVAIHTDEQDELAGVAVTLSPPNFWAATDDTPEITLGALLRFCGQCRFVYETLNTFTAGLSGRVPRESAWLDRHQQPLAYPPEFARPPNQKPKAP